ncbi:MAG: hypothetical protein GF308_10615 [Candidatus Heimdallarchaeota archaeon]|nr:hypothetical protein [Candidatus Heimdallarchaeota archaeon]
MKVLIFGAGVLGSLYAVKLQQAGQDVTLIARGKRLEELKEHGVIIENYFTKERTQRKVPVVEKLKPKDDYDLIIVIMRKSQVYAILPTLARVKNRPIILFLGNNGTGIEEYEEYLPKEQIMLGFPSAAGTRKGPEVEVLFSEKSRITLGELDGSQSKRLQQIIDLFQAANLKTTISSNIDAWLKCHLAFVLPLANALFATGGDNETCAKTRDALLICTRAMKEGVRVMKKLNYPILPRRMRWYMYLPNWVIVPYLRKLIGSDIGRIGLAAHANAAKDEMHHIAEEFQKIVDKANIPTSAIDFLNNYIPSKETGLPLIPEGSKKLPLWRKVDNYQKVLFSKE